MREIEIDGQESDTLNIQDDEESKDESKSYLKYGQS